MTRQEYYDMFHPLQIIPNVQIWSESMSMYDVERTCFRYLMVHKNLNHFYRKFLVFFSMAGITNFNSIENYSICDIEDFIRHYLSKILEPKDEIHTGYTIEYLFATRQHGLLDILGGPKLWHIEIPVFTGLSGYPDMFVQIQSPPAILFYNRLWILLEDMVHMIMIYNTRTLEQIRIIIDYIIGYLRKFQQLVLNDEFATYDKNRWNDNLTYSYQSDLTINDCHRSALINVVNQRHIRRREFWDSLY